jgi:histidinol-phosphate aminotransferase
MTGSKETVAEREKLVRELLELDYVQHITPSDANFIFGQDGAAT